MAMTFRNYALGSPSAPSKKTDGRGITPVPKPRGGGTGSSAKHCSAKSDEQLHCTLGEFLEGEAVQHHRESTSADST